MCIRDSAWASQLSSPRGRSDYLSGLIGHASTEHEPPSVSERNPLTLDAEACSWPALGGSVAREQRAAAAAHVMAARIRLESGTSAPDEPGAGLEGVTRVRQWQESTSVLLAEARAATTTRARAEIRPEYYSVTSLSRLARDREGFAAELARPMPRLVSPEQRAGIAFHRWLERRFAGQAPLVDDLPDNADSVDEALRSAFLAGPFAVADPVAVEVPFTLVVSGRLVRGRIDAVFAGTDGYRFQVVDWKTGRSRPDPLQLGIYRLAWAELHGLPLGQVAAGFYHVRDDRLDLVGDLPDRTGIESLLSELAPGVA